MSTALVADLGDTSVDGSLAEIDARTKEPQNIGNADITIGPFGVLNFGGISHETSPVDPNPPNEHVESLGDTRPTPSTLDPFDPILDFDNTLHWADLFELDFDSILMAQQISDIPGLQDFSMDGFPFDDNAAYQNSHNDIPPPYAAQAPNEAQSRHVVQQPEHNPITLTEVESPTEAQFLLKHFHDSVIPQMAFMPASLKSPWRIMNLPEAVRTLAELTYLHTGVLKHANAANLYGVLACSAYHLSENPAHDSVGSKQYWKSLFDRIREKAKGSKKAKYKDQLMAIISMLAFAIISGSQRDARCYLIDAERLLRFKGLAKRDISRKCRLLHHVYTWMRIVGESTFVTHDYRSYGSVIDNMSTLHRACRADKRPEKRSGKATSRLGHNNRLDDFLHLEPHDSDSDLDIDEVKEDDVGLHDIHLEDSRQFQGTMYQVYGISETWLSLVSQTTRLANILDASKYGKEADVKFFQFLQKRAGRLENMICSFALKDPINNDESKGDGSSEQPSPNHHMLCALNSALVILFYRRVRNVNPLILQSHVDAVAQALRDFDAALLTQSAQGPGTAWPAFIAGCEALSRRQRDFFISWLEKGFSQCGIHSFGASRDLMKDVWGSLDGVSTIGNPGSASSSQSRSQRNSSHGRTWVDISRDKNLWVILS
ncbi:hypothetical protein K469DRAFT_741505 [Zopfia rhizophila CBS 207.26]|uniref:Transcription factor domain-containing protein n=1 Tax=Zopfia rhizophila CBS 207.26 TaxID=1314779 RepID=A0A6A6DMS9_9PEZI|nr:hypothetical protein K469DRAFT_741505 [Zopfia rhizophila CBS 207.26]